MKQIGGIGLVLPRPLRSPPEYPEFAGREEAFLRQLDFEGKTIYDIGGFQGILSLFFAQRAGPRGRVVTFEPHPQNYARILEHLELNHVTNVDVRNIAIGKSRGNLRLAAAPGGLGRATANEEIQRQLSSSGTDVDIMTVPVTSLDEAIAEWVLPDPDFVKIDVEGFEVDVLEGMRQMVARRKPDLFVEVHGADLEAKRSNARRVVEFLSGFGYSLRHVESDRAVDPSTYDRGVEGHLYCY